MTVEKRLQILLACGWFMLFVAAVSLCIGALGGLCLIGSIAFEFKPFMNFAHITFFTVLGLMAFCVCNVIRIVGDHIASEYLP